MHAFNIKDVKTTPKFSQANGKAEACNKKLNQCFRVTLNEQNWKNYDLYVKYLVFCLNNLECSRTGFTPHYLVYGSHARMPRDLLVENDDRLKDILESKYNDISYKTKVHAYDLHKRMRSIVNKAQIATGQRVKYMKRQYDKNIKLHDFKAGDLCMLLELWPKHKYSKRWRGPYKVVKKISDHNYVVDADGTEKVVNLSKMKPYTKSKYSRLPPRPPKTYKSARCDKKKETFRKPDSSESSDDELWLTAYKPVFRRRSPRIATRTGSAQKSQETVTTSEAEYPSAPHVCEPEIGMQTSDQTSGAEISISGTSSQTGDVTQRRSLHRSLDESATSDQEFTDALEALDEANISREAEQSDPVTNPGANLSMNFPGLDTEITLTDIERHDQSRGTSSRSATSEANARPTSRYNLRSKIKPPERYGEADNSYSGQKSKSNKFGFKIKSPLKNKKKK